MECVGIQGSKVKGGIKGGGGGGGLSKKKYPDTKK